MSAPEGEVRAGRPAATTTPAGAEPAMGLSGEGLVGGIQKGPHLPDALILFEGVKD